MSRLRRTASMIAAAAAVACCALAALPGAAGAEIKLTRIDRFHDPVQTVAAPGPSA
jgi:hypothetical protein